MQTFTFPSIYISPLVLHIHTHFLEVNLVLAVVRVEYTAVCVYVKEWDCVCVCEKGLDAEYFRVSILSSAHI